MTTQTSAYPTEAGTTPADHALWLATASAQEISDAGDAYVNRLLAAHGVRP